MGKKQRKNRSPRKQQETKREKSGPKQDPPARDKRSPSKQESAKPKKEPGQAARDVREIVESVLIAFILAFMIRTFEAEAFQIPTGSMAPTLMGRHRDVDCPICGHRYRISASDEKSRDRSPVEQRAAQERRATFVETGICPICRYQIDMSDGSSPSYNGDRILVDKMAYRLGDPERWDVSVFRFPGNSRDNYIKRLVGLPGEHLRIQHGDIFVDPKGGDHLTIARKAPNKLKSILRLVYDNDLTPSIMKAGFPPRWESESWKPSKDHAFFLVDAPAGKTSWLRYFHRVPTQAQWKLLQREGKLQPAQMPRPKFISNFLAYNTTGTNNRPYYDGSSLEFLDQYHPQLGPMPRDGGRFWVGDLAVSFSADVKSGKGTLTTELVEGGYRFHCRINLADGLATLAIIDSDGSESSAKDINGKPFHPTAATKVRGSGKHEIMFANCDNELTLWIDGEVVPFGSTTRYLPLSNTRPTQADLQPISLGAKDIQLEVTHLKVLRDIFYIPAEESLSQPPEFVDFHIGKDQFLALGDNSAASLDGRLWKNEYEPGTIDNFVNREMLIGKAVFVYWPHPWIELPIGPRIPLFPNFSDMRFIR